MGAAVAGWHWGGAIRGKMMKYLTRVLTGLVVTAIIVICLIGVNLAIMDELVLDILHSFFFPPLIQRFILQTAAFGGIITCLTISYIYIFKRSTDKGRVRLVYAIIGLLVALAFVFSEYNNHQEKLTIRDVCTQFDLAVARKDYETAYEFMSPNYRQTHSLAQFIGGWGGGVFGESTSAGRRVTCGQPLRGKIRVVLLHPKARKARVIYFPFGSLNLEVFLEQVDDKWYFTGEIGHYPA
jgi:hypothetical protein